MREWEHGREREIEEMSAYNSKDGYVKIHCCSPLGNGSRIGDENGENMPGNCVPWCEHNMV